MARKKFIFFGRVQGVGFRAVAKMLAGKYDISGWVKNNDDGSVSLAAEGEEENIKNYIAHLKRFFHNNIERMEESEEGEEGGEGFTIQY
ncbi:MAG: acylphosphatase [Candidatus Pacebacteria bacterium]|nr:acylphosphatase [Candidatus Paceibacterota bacterium]